MAAGSTDTIIALATPPGVSALALLRLSGPDSLAFTERFLQEKSDWPPRQARHAVLRHRGELLDDVVATYWRAPHSFTGEDCVEISCHGNPLIVQRLVEAYLEAGVRAAGPGEFTERAFLNGKLDLTQAEAVLDVIHAGNVRALTGAQAMKEGRLGQQIAALQKDLVDLLSHLEAYIDFPEEDINPQTGGAFTQRVERMRQTVRDLIATAPLGRVLREGVATVIVGAPNVGKSSLLNALLRENRAIVSPTPGTTRDTIEAECNIGGLILRLTDTAGQRETSDDIEAEGIRRARFSTEQAELILHVVEAQRPPEEDPFHFPREKLREDQIYLQIANKADLGRHSSRSDAVFVSSKTGEGLADLEKTLERLLCRGAAPDNSGWLTVNARQEAALRRAEASLSRAFAALENRQPPELISIDLRGALQEFGDIVGATTNEDILDRLFKNFCIGK